MTTIDSEYTRLKALADADKACPCTHKEDCPHSLNFKDSAHAMMALIEKLRAENERLKENSLAWLEKMEWAREMMPPKYLGWHLADALKDMFGRRAP